VTTDTFDRFSTVYDTLIPQHIAGHYLERRVGFIQASAAGPLMLEVGCGTGSIAHRLTGQGFRVIGLDASLGMLKKAFEKHLPLLQADSTTLPFPAGQFDTTFCIAMLHHLAPTRETVRKTLEEMVRITRPGGTIMVCDHNPLNPYWKIFMRQLPWDKDVERLVPCHEIVQILAASGVRIMETSRRGWVPNFLPRGALRWAGPLEKILEAIPLIKYLGAHNIVVGRKNYE